MSAQDIDESSTLPPIDPAQPTPEEVVATAPENELIDQDQANPNAVFTPVGSANSPTAPGGNVPQVTPVLANYNETSWQLQTPAQQQRTAYQSISIQVGFLQNQIAQGMYSAYGMPTQGSAFAQLPPQLRYEINREVRQHILSLKPAQLAAIKTNRLPYGKAMLQNILLSGSPLAENFRTYALTQYLPEQQANLAPDKVAEITQNVVNDQTQLSKTDRVQYAEVMSEKVIPTQTPDTPEAVAMETELLKLDDFGVTSSNIAVNEEKFRRVLLEQGLNTAQIDNLVIQIHEGLQTNQDPRQYLLSVIAAVEGISPQNITAEQIQLLQEAEVYWAQQGGALVKATNLPTILATDTPLPTAANAEALLDYTPSSLQQIDFSDRSLSDARDVGAINGQGRVKGDSLESLMGTPFNHLSPLQLDSIEAKTSLIQNVIQPVFAHRSAAGPSATSSAETGTETRDKVVAETSEAYYERRKNINRDLYRQIDQQMKGQFSPQELKAIYAKVAAQNIVVTTPDVATIYVASQPVFNENEDLWAALSQLSPWELTSEISDAANNTGSYQYETYQSAQGGGFDPQQSVKTVKNIRSLFKGKNAKGVADVADTADKVEKVRKTQLFAKSLARAKQLVQTVKNSAAVTRALIALQGAISAITAFISSIPLLGPVLAVIAGAVGLGVIGAASGLFSTLGQALGLNAAPAAASAASSQVAAAGEAGGTGGSNVLNPLQRAGELAREAIANPTNTTALVGVGGTMGIAVVGAMMAQGGIMQAFLDPLPTLGTNAQISRYVVIEKRASPGIKFEDPTDITYQISVSAKAGYSIRLTQVPTDEMTITPNKETNPDGNTTPPSSDSYEDFKSGLEDMVGQTITIDGSDLGSYTIPFSGGDYDDSSVRNKFAITFDVIDEEGEVITTNETATTSEVICFGTCPSSESCWPTNGAIGQFPYSDNGPGYDKMSHAPGSLTPTGEDAFDIMTPVGTNVYATFNGSLNRPPFMADGYGNWVRLETDEGFFLIFAHLSAVEIEVGETITVAAGDLIGKSGNSGYSTGPHLHYAYTPRLPNARLYEDSLLRNIVPEGDTIKMLDAVRTCYE
ncbi:MAG: M23 family metallopeptidase [bacterium]|nr:M23 family metallopeptidase [bacterium]